MGRHPLRDNGLSLALLGLFLLSWIGQWLTGWHVCNEERRQHGQPALEALAYLGSGHFLEATGENWESEFLQMGVFVLLTAFLFQKGSPESNDPDHPEPERAVGPHSPWPLRRGGWWASVYRHSLSLAFLLLFLLSFAMHVAGGFIEYADDRREHGQPPSSCSAYLASSRFWFESLQNWQSEFLSLVTMVYLSVYLRQAGSAESKPVAAAHDEHD
jgi:hypothetical protein